MSAYYRLTDIDTVVKKEGDMAFVFDASKSQWVRDSSDLLAERFWEQDGEHTGRCVPISEKEAQDWLGQKADRME